MESFVHLLITRRRAVWRVRILSGGVIRWRAYRVSEYPTPEAVVRRCIAGLTAAREKPKGGAPPMYPMRRASPHSSTGFVFVGSFNLRYGHRRERVAADAKHFVNDG